MAVTSTDQWWGEKLKIAQQETEQAQAENAQLKLMISGATGQGGSPGQKYKPPVTNPGRGEAVFGTGKDGQRYFEFLKAMKINPNTIMLPFSTRGNDPFDDKGNDLNTPIPNPDPTQPFDWAHGEGRGRQPKYHNEYNEKLKLPPWVQMAPNGELIEIPWMKEKYLNEHPELQAMAGPDYIGDKLRYGQLDRILNPLGDFRRPTLDQLRIHSKAYPKA